MKSNTQVIINEEYQETELGLLPREWNIVRLGDYCKVLGGFAFKSEDFEKKGVLIIKIGNLQNGTIEENRDSNFFPASKINNSIKKFILKEGDVLIALTGATTGKTAIVPKKYEETLLNQRVGKFEIFNDNLNVLFNRFFISTTYFQTGIKNNILQSAQGNVSPKQIENLKIPLPPVPEQQNIAYVLSTVQEAQQATERAINSLRELKKSLMKHLFTYGAVSFEDAGKVKLQKTDIGEIPESWVKEKIARLVEKTQQKDMRNTSVGFKYIDVSGIDRGMLKIVNYNTFKGAGSPSRARKIIVTNDIIIATVRPTLKRIALVGNEYNDEICSTAFCVLRSKKELLNYKYLYYAIQREIFIENLGKIQKGASYPAVSDGEIKSQDIPLPEIIEQQQITSILSSLDEKIETEEKRKLALMELSNSLLKNLMTAKIRVKDLEKGTK